MCTFGASLYSSTASHPLSRFTASLYPWGDLTQRCGSDHLFRADLRLGAIERGEEQATSRAPPRRRVHRR